MILTLQNVPGAELNTNDKENSSGIQNTSSHIHLATFEQSEKPSLGNIKSLERYNHNVISDNMVKLLKKPSKTGKSSTVSSPKKKFESVLVEQSVGSSFLKRRKKKQLSHYEHVKDKILEEKRIRLEDESEAQGENQRFGSYPSEVNEVSGLDDLLAPLKQRNDGLRQTIDRSKDKDQVSFPSLKFSDTENSKPKAKMEKSTSRNETKDRDFLLINGEKIFFDQNTISSILNVDRIQRLVTYKNKIGSSSLEKSSGLKI